MKEIKSMTKEENQTKEKKSDLKKTPAIKRRKCISHFPGQSAGAHCLGPNKNELDVNGYR